MPSANMGPKLPRAMTPSVVLSREPLVESMVTAYKRRDTRKSIEKSPNKKKMIDKSPRRQPDISVTALSTLGTESVTPIFSARSEITECEQAISMEVDEPTPIDPLAPTNGLSQAVISAPLPSDPLQDPLQVEETISTIVQPQAIDTPVDPVRGKPTLPSCPKSAKPNQVRDKHRSSLNTSRKSNTTKKSLSADSAVVLLNFLWNLHVAARKRLERTQREFEASSKALLAFAKENNLAIPDVNAALPEQANHAITDTTVQTPSVFASNPVQTNGSSSTQLEDLESFARGIVCPVFMTGSDDSESTISDPAMMVAQAEMPQFNSTFDTTDPTSRFLFDHYLASLDESPFVSDPLSSTVDGTRLMYQANGLDPLSVQTTNAARGNNVLLTSGMNYSGTNVSAGFASPADHSGWWTPPTMNTSTGNSTAKTPTSGQPLGNDTTKCTRCGKMLNKRSLSRHLKICGRTFPCDKCGQAFTSHNLARSHMSICTRSPQKNPVSITIDD